MLVIRFFRTGKKNQPFFRIVVTDKRNPPQGGRFLEILGNFDPRTKETNLKPERIKYWLSVGAKPSNRVHNLLIENEVIDGEKTPVHNKPKRDEKEEKKTGKKKPEKSEEKPEKSEEKPEKTQKETEEDKKETKKTETKKAEDKKAQQREQEEKKIEKPKKTEK